MKYFLTIFLFVCNLVTQCQNIQVSLKHSFGNYGFARNKNFGLSTAGDSISVSTLKYYISNIEIQLSSGKKMLDNKTYHLIEVTSTEVLSLIDLKIPNETITNISFGIGVDSLANSKGLMDGDLDPMNGMYWAWSSGFINFKLEGQYTIGTSRDSFSYHIGGFQRPNQTYRRVSLPINIQPNLNLTTSIQINCNLKTLFESFSPTEKRKILSPSTKAKEFSLHLPKMFTVAK